MSGLITEDDIEWVSELINDNIGREYVMPVAYCHGSNGQPQDYCGPDVPCGLCRAMRFLDKLRAQRVRDAELAKGLVRMQELADEGRERSKQYDTAIAVIRARGEAVDKAIQADAAAVLAVWAATGVIPPRSRALRDTTLVDFVVRTEKELFVRVSELHPFRLLLMESDLRSDVPMEWSSRGPRATDFMLPSALIEQRASEIVYIAHGARTVLKAGP